MKLPFISFFRTPVPFITALLLGLHLMENGYLLNTFFRSVTLSKMPVFFAGFCSIYAYVFGLMIAGIMYQQIRKIATRYGFRTFLSGYMIGLIGLAVAPSFSIFLGLQFFVGLCFFYCLTESILMLKNELISLIPFLISIILGGMLAYVFVQGFDFMSGIIVQILLAFALLLLYGNEGFTPSFRFLKRNMIFMFIGVLCGCGIGVYYNFFIGIIWGIVIVFFAIAYLCCKKEYIRALS